jgi:hypothetical protein
MTKNLTTLRPREQVSSQEASIEWVMSSPYFEYGVNDKRAKRGFRTAYTDWEINDQWNYERGRAWASVAPRSLALKLHGKLNPRAVALGRKVKLI